MASKSDKRGPSYNQLESGTEKSRPLLHQEAHEIQPYGKIAKLPIALDEKVCAASAENLNQLLADTITLRDLYKKHHWQVAGHTFYQLHLLFDKHYDEQNELVDTIAERIQSSWRHQSGHGSGRRRNHHHPSPPARPRRSPRANFAPTRSPRDDPEGSPHHGRQADEAGDDGTNDLLVSEVIRTNELQVWFVAEHAVDVPVVRADQAKAASSGNR